MPSMSETYMDIGYFKIVHLALQEVVNYLRFNQRQIKTLCSVQSLAEYWKNLDLYAFLFILIYISVIFIAFCGIYLENID